MSDDDLAEMWIKMGIPAIEEVEMRKKVEQPQQEGVRFLFETKGVQQFDFEIGDIVTGPLMRVTKIEGDMIYCTWLLEPGGRNLTVGFHRSILFRLAQTGTLKP